MEREAATLAKLTNFEEHAAFTSLRRRLAAIALIVVRQDPLMLSGTLMFTLQRINARRGLLRLWVAVSVTWVLIVGITYWSHLSELFVAVDPSAGRGAVTLAPGPYACWATRNPDNPFAFIPQNERSPTSLADAWRQCVAYKMDIPVKALAPPLALLALGYAVAWVIKGFQKC